MVGISKHEDIPKIVYIAGYGRSGSTLLDTILGNHPDVFGAGELTWLFRDAVSGAQCTCGQHVTECSFWRRVLESALGDFTTASLASAAEVTLHTECLFRSKMHVQRYLKLWRKTLSAISSISGKAIIIDSSKSSRLAHNRLPLFLKHFNESVLFIHLVRDPRGVMWSVNKGSNRWLEGKKVSNQFGGMIRGLGGWIFSNTSVELMSKSYKKQQKLFLRYEDLVSEPKENIDRLGSWLEISLESVLDRIGNQEVFDGGHGLAGNRMRRNSQIKLNIDNEWQRKLPKHAKIMAGCALPLMNKYEYKMF